MQGVNKVILIGNLGKDPEVRHFEGGRSKAGFTLATNDSYRDREGNRTETTEWHQIVIWQPHLVELATKYLHKGSPVYVEGRLRTRQYQDRENVTRSVTEIVVEEMTLLGARPTGTNGDAQPAARPEPATYVQEPEPDALPF